MKELTIEQKAKAYDEVREKIAIRFGSNVADEIFSQFEMSEDEKIRKELLNAFQKSEDSLYMVLTPHRRESFIAWLENQCKQKVSEYDVVKTIKERIIEYFDNHLIIDRCFSIGGLKDDILKIINEVKSSKQSEQNPTDKIEPKFHEGDWVIIDGETLHITNVTEDGYSTEEGGHIPFRCEKDARLWTIQDAKDGDVLMSRAPFIYGIQIPYGGLDWYSGKFIKASYYVFKDSPVHPATKEQRDTLLKAMADAGYTFDFKKKELKKIDTYCQDNCKGFQETGRCFCDGECKDKKEYIKQNLQDNSFRRMFEQKPAWSEEDERMYKGLHNLIYSTPYCDSRKELSDFLESLKDRIQPKQEWSEEDAQILNAAILHMKNETYNYYGGYSSEYIMQWLKSIKDKVQPQNK